MQQRALLYILPGLIASCSIASCSTEGTVRKDNGKYVFDYNRTEVYSRFGDNRLTAVPAYLQAKGLVPNECTQGITVDSGGDSVGGWSWAYFRCNK